VYYLQLGEWKSVRRTGSDVTQGGVDAHGMDRFATGRIGRQLRGNEKLTLIDLLILVVVVVNDDGDS
jgi:hypothetical protein